MDALRGGIRNALPEGAIVVPGFKQVHRAIWDENRPRTTESRKQQQPSTNQQKQTTKD